MTPYEKYQHDLNILQYEYGVKVSKIQEELKLAQNKCKHDWEFVSELFYALDNYMDGYKCKLCNKKKMVDENN